MKDVSMESVDFVEIVVVAMRIKLLVYNFRGVELKSINAQMVDAFHLLTNVQVLGYVHLLGHFLVEVLYAMISSKNVQTCSILLLGSIKKGLTELYLIKNRHQRRASTWIKDLFQLVTKKIQIASMKAKKFQSKKNSYKNLEQIHSRRSDSMKL